MTHGHILTDGHLDMTNCHTTLTNSSFRSDQKSSPNDFSLFGHMGMTLFGRVNLDELYNLSFHKKIDNKNIFNNFKNLFLLMIKICKIFV